MATVELPVPVAILLLFWANDDWFCDFLDAGPELTPGLSPVFGELEPLFDPGECRDDDDDDVLCDGDDESFVRVLLIVIFMPSELGFTMYSLLLPELLRFD